MSRTDDGEPSEAAPTPEVKPARKRRKKRRVNADTAALAAEPTTPPTSTSGTFYLAAAVTGVAGLVVGMSILSPTETPYAIVVVGVAAFFAGANYPQPEKMLRACMAMAAVGLAGLATTTSPWAIAAAVAGGIGLGGAIHRLGREGPEDAAA